MHMQIVFYIVFISYQVWMACVMKYYKLQVVTQGVKSTNSSCNGSEIII